MTTLTSRSGEVTFGPGQPLVLINDQLRVLDQAPQAPAELQEGVVDRMVALACHGKASGMDMVDILVTYPGLDESVLLPRIAVAVHEAIGCPVVLDSRHPGALRAALGALRPYKALVNSVTAEVEVLTQLMPIVAEFGAALVGMPVGDRYGLPKDVDGRISEAETILESAVAHGIHQDDVVIDAICLASSVEPGSMAVTLETLRRLHEDLGVATTLGIGNAGHGMPNKTHIDLAYLVAAVSWGLDSALVDPRTPHLIEETRAIDFLTGRDAYGLRYIRHYRSQSRSTEDDGSVS